MTWFAASANETESAKDHYLPFAACSFDFPSAFVRLWTGVGDITLLGQVYQGVGHIGRIKSVPERSNLTVDRKSYQLAGEAVNPALIPESDIDNSFKRTVIEYLGFLHAETRQLLADPEIAFEGEIANIRRVDGPEPIIEVNADNRLIMLNRNDGWRFTHTHQAQFYTGDNGLDKMADIELIEVQWGGSNVGGGFGGGGTREGPSRPTRPV